MNGALPNGWIEISLADAGNWCSGGTPSRRRAEFFGKGIPWVKSGDLPDGPILSTEEQITEAGLNNSSAKLLPTGTISIALYGATIGKLGIMTFPAATNQACANVIPDGRIIDTKFLYFYLRSERQKLIDQGQGGAQPNISQEIVRSHPFVLAPYQEQQRIVMKLEKLLANLERSQKRLATTPKTLKRFRQSVLAASCSGRLTADWRSQSELVAPLEKSDKVIEDLPAIPKTWKWIKLPQTGEMNRGKSRHRPRDESSLYGGIYPFIQTGDIAQSGGRIRSHRQTYSEKGLAQSRLWPAGTVCITIAANIAESAILTYPSCFPDSVVGIIVDPKRCLPEYVEYFIRVAKNDLSTFAPATAQKNINIAILSELSVPLPPLDEQHEIVRRVGGLFELADKIEARYKTVQQQVDRLPQSILAKAFRGELVPTEAELAEREGLSYESADELLNRIRKPSEHILGPRDSGARKSLNKSIIDGISLDGFSEPVTIDELRQTRCGKVPEESGIYVIIRPSDSAPHFLRKSTGGWFKDLDPSYPLKVVHENWVEGAQVMYVGMTAADGGLRSRLCQFFDFGAGKRVGHRGGRLLWHLQDSGELQVRWRTCAASKANSAEDHAIASFKSVHDGRRPFANMIK